MVSLRDTVNQSSLLHENQVSLKELLFATCAIENSAEVLCILVMCILVTFYERGHFVMLIIKSMHLINLHFWTYLFNYRKLIKVTSGNFV